MTDPTVAKLFGVAVQHHRAGRLGEAANIYRQIIACDDDHVDALHMLGVVAAQQGENADALDLIRRAIALKPDMPEALNSLGNVLHTLGKDDDAVAAYHRAIALRSDFALAHCCLANALTAQGRLPEAIQECHRAIALDPDLADAHCNLGNALLNMARLDESIASSRRAVHLAPAMAQAHNNLAFALLARGELSEGWKEAEWRSMRDLSSVAPRWEGSPLEGRTILIHCEEGIGDTIHFARYLSQVISRGGKVIIECQRELRRLFLASWPALSDVRERGAALPHFDVQCPLLSLPLSFQTMLPSIPARVPYLRADATAVETWRGRLAAQGAGTNVGLVWAGSPEHGNDRNRSLSAHHFAQLVKIPGVRLLSLQKGRVGLAHQLHAPNEWLDFMDHMTDFADTAALVANLDLVISVDTAMAHLAGAMGKPVWTLLPFASDWRWLRDRDDSPWYPTMRLFRQTTAGDWGNVMQRVAETLRNLAAG